MRNRFELSPAPDILFEEVIQGGGDLAYELTTTVLASSVCHDTPRRKSFNAAELVLLLLSIICFAAIARYYFNDTFVDDAYISFKYARNLIGGFGLVWDPGGPHVEGFTNLLWVLELALSSSLTGIDIPRVALWSGIAWAIATIVIVWLAARRLTGSRLAVTAAVALAFSAAFARHAVSGLETAQVTCLIALLCLAFTVRFRSSVAEASVYGLLTVAAGIARPDAALIALAASIPILSLHASDPQTRRLAMGLYLSIVGLSVGVYLLWTFRYFGSFVPLPFFIKSRGWDILHNRRLAKDTLFYILSYYKYISTMFLIILIGLIARWPRSAFAGLIILSPLVFTAYMLQVVSIMGFDWRFFMPTLPIFVLAASVLLIGFVDMRDSWKSRRSACGAIALIMFFCFQDLGSYGRMGHDAYALARLWDNQVELAGELRNIPDLEIAGSEAGQLSYFSGAAFFDYVGLNEPFIARNRFATPDFPTLYAGYLMAMKRKPDLYLKPPSEYPYADLANIPEIRTLYDGPFIFAGDVQAYILHGSKHYRELLNFVQKIP